MEGHMASQKDAKAREVLEVGVQPSKMEINMIASKATNARRRTTILDRTTLVNRSIHIPNLDIFIWIHMKQNYDKHVERLEN